MTRRRPDTAPPSPVTVRPVRNAAHWGSLPQLAIVCALCGDRVISVNISRALADDEAAEHLATHTAEATAP